MNENENVNHSESTLDTLVTDIIESSEISEEASKKAHETITIRQKVTPEMLKTRKIRKLFGIRLPSYKREIPKIQRNELCPCGSGKKYKYCCLNSNLK